MNQCPNCGSVKDWQFVPKEETATPPTEEPSFTFGRCAQCGFIYVEEVGKPIESQLKRHRAKILGEVRLCKRCKEFIRFIRSARNPDKYIPVEAQLKTFQSTNSKYRLVTEGGVVVYGIKVGDVGYEPHWGYCSSANQFRKERA